jgi:hypothetical protein
MTSWAAVKDENGFRTEAIQFYLCRASERG